MQCLDNRVVNHSRCPNGQRFNRNVGRCTSADQVPCLGMYLLIYSKELLNSLSEKYRNFVC